MERFYFLKSPEAECLIDLQKIINVSLDRRNVTIYMPEKSISITVSTEKEAKITYDSVCSAWVDWRIVENKTDYRKMANMIFAIICTLSMQFVVIKTINGMF